MPIKKVFPLIKVLLWLSLALVMLYPLLWTVLSSMKGSNVEIFDHPFALPKQINWVNYQKAIREGHMGGYFINSLWVTVLSAVLVVMLGVWGGFALSKTRFPFQRFWLALFFIGMILPVQAFLIPLIDLLQTLGIHDSLWALIFPYTAQTLPVAVLLLAAYFRSLPVELEEAAKLDGVRTGRFYFGILLPVAKPAIGTVVVISCLNTWNEFLMSLLFIVDPRLKTLPVGMITFEQAHNTDYPALLAGLALISVPTLLAYALFNKQVIRGVVAGTVK
ncbi:MAG TPA: carbohydrate ABC transporter permease [Candidatus Eisenbacteria bacterium]|jgi:raffinose/stachyose/melibiose transport system permease protein|nr:carbohydrate ABC transporter permease [Candidatus Eisenbacteria bacterium]